jgi:hypothetical protein
VTSAFHGAGEIQVVDRRIGGGSGRGTRIEVGRALLRQGDELDEAASGGGGGSLHFEVSLLKWRLH